MRICIDNVSPGLSTSSKTIGGMRDYLFHFVRSLAFFHPKHEYAVLSPSWNESTFALPGLGIIDIEVPCPKSRVFRVFFEQSLYAYFVERTKSDLFVGIHNIVPPNLKMPAIVFIKSLQYLIDPPSYGALRRNYLRKSMTRSISSAFAVVVPSEFSKRTLLELSGLFEISEKVKVIHEAPYVTHEKMEEVKSRGKDKQIETIVGGMDYFLTVGALYKYKRTKLILETFAEFLRISNQKMKFVVIGASAGDSIDILKALATELSISDSVIFLGHMPREFIFRAYANARMFLFFSEFETFGHPILEAMMAKCPVFTTNYDLHSEIAGGHSFLAKGESPEELAAELSIAITSENELERRVEAGYGKTFEYTWERVANEFAKVVDEVSR